VKHRKRIAVGEKIPLELTERERDLIMKHTFAGNNLTDRLRVVPSRGQRPFYRFTLDDLDELAYRPITPPSSLSRSIPRASNPPKTEVIESLCFAEGVESDR
jgi:hypothetical protein